MNNHKKRKLYKRSMMSSEHRKRTTPEFSKRTQTFPFSRNNSKTNATRHSVSPSSSKINLLKLKTISKR